MKKVKRSIVKSIDELKKLCSSNRKDFYISLAGGLCRSSKEIEFDEDTNTFSVLHEIDGTFGEYNEKELGEQTNIVEAIEKNCLILEIY